MLNLMQVYEWKSDLEDLSGILRSLDMFDGHLIPLFALDKCTLSTEAFGSSLCFFLVNCLHAANISITVTKATIFFFLLTIGAMIYVLK